MQEIQAEHSESSGFFEVQLELFDGPLDLLLHLVKKRELAIEKIALAAVSEQYLRCVQQAKYLDLEVAGEYLVIAATLVSIKAAILLDDPVELIPDEEGNLVDPHEELLRRLRELEAYRAAAGLLEMRPVLGIDVFAPVAAAVKIDPSDIPLGDHESALLVKALHRVLARQKAVLPPLQIMVDIGSVVERMQKVIEILQAARGTVSFQALIPTPLTRGAIIGTFVAILELCKRSAVKVAQQAWDEEIVVKLADDGREADLSSPVDSISEEVRAA
jgi:segregation and condensation protein A